MNVLDYKNKLNSINVQSIVKDAVNKHSEQIVKVNQQELSQGKNFFGESVGVYSKATEDIAKKENPRKPKKAGSPFNFEYTGELFDGMFIKYNGKVIKISSKGKGDSEKTLFVEGNNLLGFNDVSAVIINYDILLPDLQNKIKQILS